MRAIIAVICPLVSMMTLASVRPDNGVNVTPASQTETGVNEIEKKSEEFFSYQIKGVYKPTSQCAYKYDLGVSRSRDVRGAVICSGGFYVKGLSPLLGEYYFTDAGLCNFRFPLSARHKQVKVSTYHFRAFNPNATGDVIAERLTAYVDFYPCDSGKTKVRFEVTQLHRSDLAEYKKWSRDAERQRYLLFVKANPLMPEPYQARSSKERRRETKKIWKLYDKVEAMKNK